METTQAIEEAKRQNKALENGSNEIFDKTLTHLSQVFQMLGDRSRLKIVLALAKKGEMNVSALCELLGQSQPAVSHHLRLLRFWSLVSYRREGKHNFYRLDSASLGDLLEDFLNHFCNDANKIQFDNFSLTFSRNEIAPPKTPYTL